MGGGKYALRSDYDPKLVGTLKSVPGMVWDPKDRVWVGYADAFVELGRLDGGVRRELGPGFGEADDKVLYVGGGAPQLLGAAQALNQRTLILCPGAQRESWEYGLKKEWPDASYGVLDGVKEVHAIPPWLVVVCHYDILYAWEARLAKWRGGPLDRSIPGPKTLILDGAQLLASSKSRRSVAARSVAGLCTHRMGQVEALPSPKDLWNVVDILSPGRFGTFFKYASRYCGAEQKTIGFGADAKTVWAFGGTSNVEELRRRLAFFVRGVGEERREDLGDEDSLRDLWAAVDSAPGSSQLDSPQVGLVDDDPDQPEPPLL